MNVTLILRKRKEESRRIPFQFDGSKENTTKQISKIDVCLGFRCLNAQDQISLVFPHFGGTRAWEGKNLAAALLNSITMKENPTI